MSEVARQRRPFSARKRHLRMLLAVCAACGGGNLLAAAVLREVAPTIGLRPLAVFVVLSLMFLMYAFLALGALSRECLVVVHGPQSEAIDDDDDTSTLALAHLRRALSWTPNWAKAVGFLGIAIVVFAALFIGGVTLDTSEALTATKVMGACVWLGGMLLLPVPPFASTLRMPGCFAEHGPFLRGD